MLKVKDIIKRQIHPYIPNFSVAEFFPRKNDYAIIIPTLNEGLRLQRQLEKMKGMNLKGDIVISDAPSHDNSTNPDTLKKLGVNALIKLTEEGGVSSSLRAAFCYCLNKNYQGIITIDGNDKDDTKTVKKFIHQLKQGYDFIQGSRFLKGGHEMNTPKSRLLLIKWLHAPIMNLVSGFRFTDTTNGFRASCDQKVPESWQNTNENKFVSRILENVEAIASNLYRVF